MKLLSVRPKNPGNRVEIKPEQIVDNLDFDVVKFNNRPKPTDPKKILITCCFSEFGCEIVGALYAVPQLFRNNPGKYKIVVGWHGREYLYKHLADEFWAIKPEFMWLREYARAFHHKSMNLKYLEGNLCKLGNVVKSDSIGKLATSAVCHDCRSRWGNLTKIQNCPSCKSTNIEHSLFGDVNAHKPNVCRIPTPCIAKLNKAKEYLGPNPVGIFARGRKCYGRNLEPEFYSSLIKNLESKGYTPVWLGEKASTIPCPEPHIVDFSRMDEAKDLELTLAIIKQLKFTIQFWTASTRLSAIMGTPYIIFESPDQIWGIGQEGYRLNLCNFSSRKLVLSHYLNVVNDPVKALGVLDKCIDEVEAGNFDDVFGLLESEHVAQKMKLDNSKRIGGE